MAQHLKLELTKAQEAYKKGDADVKKLLIDLYGKEHFLTDIKDRVIDYESACREIGIEPLTEKDFGILPKEDRKRYYNRHQLTIVVRALVGDWKPDWDNSNEYKYYMYFYKEKSGFASHTDCYCDLSFVGSDLLFPNSDLANYAGKIMRQQYIDYLF